MLEYNEDLLNSEKEYGPIYYQNFCNDRYDARIQVEYLGTDIDLGLQSGDRPIIGRDDNGKLCILCKIKFGQKPSEEFIEYMFKKDISTYIHYEPFPNEIKNYDDSLNNSNYTTSKYTWL